MVIDVIFIVQIVKNRLRRYVSLNVLLIGSRFLCRLMRLFVQGRRHLVYRLHALRGAGRHALLQLELEVQVLCLEELDLLALFLILFHTLLHDGRLVQRRTHVVYSYYAL